MMIDALSVHEPGHATIGERLGLPATAITLKTSGGVVHFGRYPVPRSNAPVAKLRERLKIDGLVALSGPIAESRFSHEPVHRILARNAAGDRHQARIAASAYALAQREWDADARYQLFDDWLEETRQLVRTNWFTILVLAEKLALNGRLDGRDVLRVLELADRQAVSFHIGNAVPMFENAAHT